MISPEPPERKPAVSRRAFLRLSPESAQRAKENIHHLSIVGLVMQFPLLIIPIVVILLAGAVIDWMRRAE